MLGNCFFWRSSNANFEVCGSQITTVSGFLWGLLDPHRSHLFIQACESNNSLPFFTVSTMVFPSSFDKSALWSERIVSLSWCFLGVGTEPVMLLPTNLRKPFLILSWDEFSAEFELFVPWAEEPEELSLRRLTHLLVGSALEESFCDRLGFGLGWSECASSTSTSKLWVLEELGAMFSDELAAACKAGGSRLISGMLVSVQTRPTSFDEATSIRVDKVDLILKPYNTLSDQYGGHGCCRCNSTARIMTTE